MLPDWLPPQSDPLRSMVPPDRRTTVISIDGPPAHPRSGVVGGMSSAMPCWLSSVVTRATSEGDAATMVRGLCRGTGGVGDVIVMVTDLASDQMIGDEEGPGGAQAAMARVQPKVTRNVHSRGAER